MTKHSRFLHIENRRVDDAPESESADRGRIAAVLGSAPSAQEAVPLEVAPEQPAGDGRVLDRAGKMQEIEDVPDSAIPDLNIDVAPVEGQPFVRCARCRSDNTIHAKECDNCAALLDTDEQRTFNDRVWSTHRAELVKERAAIAVMEEKRAEQRRNTMRPLPGLSPPPELVEPMGDDEGPFLIEALRALQKKEQRWGAVAAMVGVPLLLVTVGGPLMSKIGWGIVVLLVIAMLPRRLARTVFEAWFGSHRRR